MSLYCPHCLTNNPDDSLVCSRCGKDMLIHNESNQLPVNSILNGRYLIGKVLGEGGFGIVYVGLDLRLDTAVAIKEYYPSGIVNRISTYSSSVTIAGSSSKGQFEGGRERFLNEARLVTKFRGNPNIVDIMDFFYENGTAYIVMEFLSGGSLSQLLAAKGPLKDFSKLYEMIRPVMQALDKLHSEGLIHRDISPSNLMFSKEGQIKLIDFGAVRQSNAEDEKSLSVVLKHGYAPVEQYQSHGRQGAWTDVYALCATMYKLLTGTTPMNVTDRLSEELPLPSSLGAEISPAQEKVLMHGMALQQKDRIQNMTELMDAFDKAALSVNDKEPAKKPKKTGQDTADHEKTENKSQLLGLFKHKQADKEKSGTASSASSQKSERVSKSGVSEPLSKSVSKSSKSQGSSSGAEKNEVQGAVPASQPEVKSKSPDAAPVSQGKPQGSAVSPVKTQISVESQAKVQSADNKGSKSHDNTGKGKTPLIIAAAAVAAIAIVVFAMTGLPKSDVVKDDGTDTHVEEVIATSKPEVATPKPEVATSKPEVATPKPEVATPKPEVATE